MSFQFKYFEDFKTLRQKLKIWRDFENYLSTLDGDESALLRLMLMRPVIDNRTDRGYERDLYDRYKYARQTGWNPEAALAEPANKITPLPSRTHSPPLSPLRTSSPPPLPPLPPAPPQHAQPRRTPAPGPIHTPFRIPMSAQDRERMLFSLNWARAQAEVTTTIATAAAEDDDGVVDLTATEDADEDPADEDPADEDAAAAEDAVADDAAAATDTHAATTAATTTTREQAVRRERLAAVIRERAIVAAEQAQVEVERRERQEWEAGAPQRLEEFRLCEEAKTRARKQQLAAARASQAPASPQASASASASPASPQPSASPAVTASPVTASRAAAPARRQRVSATATATATAPSQQTLQLSAALPSPSSPVCPQKRRTREEVLDENVAKTTAIRDPVVTRGRGTPQFGLLPRS